MDASKRAGTIVALISGKPAAPALLHVLKNDESPFVRGAAAEALSQMREVSPEAISVLRAATHDLDDGMRGSAIEPQLARR